MKLNFQRFVFIFAIALIIPPVFQQQFDESYNYDTFYIQFNRKYVGQERADHEAIFNQKFAEIQKLRKQGHDVIVNEYTDWNSSQIAGKNKFKIALATFNPNAEGVTFTQRPLRASYVMASPASHDWRALNRVTPVRNQLNCGSCWAFAATAVFESQYAIQTNGTLLDFSEQYLVECQKNSSACNGGMPYYALKLANNTGMPLEVNYPYKAASSYYSSLSKPICTDTNRTKLPKPLKLVTYNNTSTAEQLQQDLITYGPISVGVLSDQAPFMSVGPSGLISCTNNTGQIDHAITLVGYNSSHWFVKNSWGTGWGHLGYGYISKTANCGIYTYISVAMIDLGNSSNTTNVTNVTLTITMTDSKSNGWNGTVLGFSQDGATVATFGSNFTSKGSLGPVYATINGKLSTRIIVTTLGTAAATSEIGFVVKFPNGTVILNRTAGTVFNATTVFSTFCPLGGCPTAPVNNTYYLYATAACDGWGGNQLAIRQNGTYRSIFTLTTGRAGGPMIVNLTRDILAQLVVYKLGNNSQDVGVRLASASGATVLQLKQGTTFVANSVLGSFTPNSVNQSPVAILEPADTISSSSSSSSSDLVAKDQQSKGLLIATCVVSGIAGILLIGLIAALLKIRQQQKLLNKNEEKECNPESAKDIMKTETDVNSNKQTISSFMK